MITRFTNCSDDKRETTDIANQNILCNIENLWGNYENNNNIFTSRSTFGTVFSFVHSQDFTFLSTRFYYSELSLMGTTAASSGRNGNCRKRYV